MPEYQSDYSRNTIPIPFLPNTAETVFDWRGTFKQHIGFLTSDGGIVGVVDETPKIDETIERRFRELAEQWYLETMPLSSYVEKILHPAYQKILVLGKRVVPFIMDELRDMPNDWFWALRMLTDIDPVQDGQSGDMQMMTDAWLGWWAREGLTWQQKNGLA